MFLNQAKKVQLLIFSVLEDILITKKSFTIKIMDRPHLALKVQRFQLLIKERKNLDCKVNKTNEKETPNPKNNKKNMVFYCHFLYNMDDIFLSISRRFRFVFTKQ